MADQGQQDLHFRCADVGDKSCKWEARGKNEKEIMDQVERHGREAHNVHMDDNMRRQVSQAINRRAA